MWSISNSTSSLISFRCSLPIREGINKQIYIYIYIYIYEMIWTKVKLSFFLWGGGDQSET